MELMENYIETKIHFLLTTFFTQQVARDTSRAMFIYSLYIT